MPNTLELDVAGREAPNDFLEARRALCRETTCSIIEALTAGYGDSVTYDEEVHGARSLVFG